MFFFFNDTATTEIYTLSLHDALPICKTDFFIGNKPRLTSYLLSLNLFTIVNHFFECIIRFRSDIAEVLDRKSTRLNSSHANISYAVFCLKKKIKSIPSLDVSNFFLFL